MQTGWAHVLGCDVKKQNKTRTEARRSFPQTLWWLLLAFRMRVNISNKSLLARPEPAPPCFQADLGLPSPHDSCALVTFHSFCFVYFLHFAKPFSTRELAREFVPLPEKGLFLSLCLGQLILHLQCSAKQEFFTETVPIIVPHTTLFPLHSSAFTSFPEHLRFFNLGLPQ